MIADATGLILAGGDSRRMGQDKPTLLLDGETLLARVADRMRPLFANLIVSVRSHREDIYLPQVCDVTETSGPLAGVLAGMASAQTPWVFVLACDMPFVVPPLVERLAEMRGNYQAVVPVVGGHAQPLGAFYARSALADLQDFVAAGGRSLRDSLQHLRVNFVDEAELQACDSQLRSFFDLDTPQDIEAARKRG